MLPEGAGPEPCCRSGEGLRCKIETLRGSRCLLWTAISDLVKLDPKRCTQQAFLLSFASSCIACSSEPWFGAFAAAGTEARPAEFECA